MAARTARSLIAGVTARPKRQASAPSAGPRGHYSILTTARYTHLSRHTNDQASARIQALMSRFNIDWAGVK